MNEELYVFWENGRFPYCLGGGTTNFKKDLAYVPSYLGYAKPFLVTDMEVGVKLKSEIDSLENLRDIELRELNEKYDNKLKELIRVPRKIN